jgi:hypothetical protein
VALGFGPESEPVVAMTDPIAGHDGVDVERSMWASLEKPVSG